MFLQHLYSIASDETSSRDPRSAVAQLAGGLVDEDVSTRLLPWVHIEHNAPNETVRNRYDIIQIRDDQGLPRSNDDALLMMLTTTMMISVCFSGR